MSVTDASAVEASTVATSVICACFLSFTVGCCGALRGVRVGVCTTWGCDTPATRRQRASCSAKPPSHQIDDRTVRNSRRCGGGIVRAGLLPKAPPQGSSPRRLLKAPPQGSSPRRRQGHLSTNFACNSPTVRIDASLKTAEFQRSDFKI